MATDKIKAVEKEKIARRHPEVESFVILDDSDYEWGELAEHWVATSFYEENGGLREEHVEKALYILNNKRRVRNGAGK